MKKIIDVLFMVLVIICMTGCNTNDMNTQEETKEKTIEDYIDRFTGVSNLKCDDLDKYDIIDVSNDLFLLSNGTIYSYLGQSDKLYSNNQQCKSISDNIKFKYINDSRLISEDNKVYYYSSESGLNESDEKIPSVLFKDGITHFKLTGLSSEEEKKYKHSYNSLEDKELITVYYKYLYIKNGNIYEGIIKNKYYRYYSNDKEVPISNEIVEEKVLYSSEEYGYIKDYRFIDNYIDSYSKIISDKGMYVLSDIETDECKKYEDVKCERGFVKDDRLDKYMSEIKYIDVNYIVTNNKSIGYIDDIFEEISR